MTSLTLIGLYSLVALCVMRQTVRERSLQEIQHAQVQKGGCLKPSLKLSYL